MSEVLLRAFILAGNLAIVAALMGLTHLFAWSGPGYAAGVISGAILFATWCRLHNGVWP